LQKPSERHKLTKKKKKKKKKPVHDPFNICQLPLGPNAELYSYHILKFNIGLGKSLLENE